MAQVNMRHFPVKDFMFHSILCAFSLRTFRDFGPSHSHCLCWDSHSLSMSDDGVAAHGCLFIQTDLPRGTEWLRGVGLLKAHGGRHLALEGDSTFIDYPAQDPWTHVRALQRGATGQNGETDKPQNCFPEGTGETQPKTLFMCLPNPP